ncbi:hypothetical protein BJ508DRAFT_367130 [Ascobolus immersus RN42]|uniref:Gram-positive cocci surface proteins LPxTG domain-containing protein n=1 Tax=Ascobolus immersus RN42 TaxID=1160509 RepID=A0A3N4HSJ0_ASCIM|nr:hypothetical protein BJ508DRAFT_367130 [Ascobolus immersus RN42]
MSQPNEDSANLSVESIERIDGDSTEFLYPSPTVLIFTVGPQPNGLGPTKEAATEAPAARNNLGTGLGIGLGGLLLIIIIAILIFVRKRRKGSGGKKGFEFDELDEVVRIDVQPRVLEVCEGVNKGALVQSVEVQVSEGSGERH